MAAQSRPRRQIADAPAAPPQAPAAGDGLGDCASPAALARLDRAAAEPDLGRLRPLLSRAIAALGAQDAATALDLARQALVLDDRNGVAWYLLAIACEKTSDFKASIGACEQALALAPNPAVIANDMGRLAFRLGMKAVAAKLFQHYHAAFPDCAEGANSLACALRDLNRYEAAIEAIRPAVLAHPERSALWNTLGTVLAEQGDMTAAQTFFDESLRLDPDFAKARYNRANGRLEVGDTEGALADCEAAMAGAASPGDLAMMRMARATMRLCQGRLGDGWDDYEGRLDPDFAGATHFEIDRPRWTPASDLAGKSLLLVGEQGLGDEVMFANLVPDVLAALGPDGRLSLAVESRLVALFRRGFPAVAVSAHVTRQIDARLIREAPFVDEPRPIDLWAPLASPLRRFRRDLEAFPDRARYLTPDPRRVDHWRGQLARRPGLKVGLLWKSLKLQGSRLRYFSPFEHWRPVLAVPGVSFVNLQYGDCEAELARARDEMGLDIWRPPGVDLKDDLDEVAALSCALDLVIGPANATSNIAAACGAAVWLISTIACWPRLGTRRYPWYPQCEVFIPDAVGAGEPTMRAVADRLARRVFLGTQPSARD